MITETAYNLQVQFGDQRDRDLFQCQKEKKNAEVVVYAGGCPSFEESSMSAPNQPVRKGRRIVPFERDGEKQVPTPER